MQPSELEPSLNPETPLRGDDAAPAGVPSGYRDARVFARFAQVLLALNPLLLVGTFALAVAYSVVAAATGALPLTESMIGLADVAEVVLRIVTAIAFITWLHRAAKNMRALTGSEPETGVPMAIVAWFIPCANFWVPYQVVSEVDRRSSDGSVVGAASSPLVSAWWATWVVTMLLLNAASRVQDESLSLLLAAALMAAELASASLAILVIHRIQKNQAALLVRRDVHTIAAQFE